MESEQSQNFNDRLSQWVANQGFWFQLRYSMSGSGATGTAAFHVLRMAFRLVVFLMVIAACGWVYLMKRIPSESFNEDLKVSLKSGFSSSECDIDGVSRSQGKLGINRLTLQGGGETFFSLLEARNVRFNMGLLDGLTGRWDTGTVSASRLDLDLRAGADDPESAKKLADSLFKNSPDVLLNSVEVADASLRWGYSPSTWGSITNSWLKVQRMDNSMILTFRGGTFSQNWLKKLDIINLVVVCNPDGLVFEKAEFSNNKGQGRIDFSGLRLTGGERPIIEGVVKLKKLDLDGILPGTFRDFIEGTISGDFKVSGSTNTTEGVSFAGKVNLDGQDVVVLRRSIHLLQALSDIDYVRNYHRVEFDEGSFQITTGSGGMEVTDVNLKAKDLLMLEGNMKVRLPTDDEKATSFEAANASHLNTRFTDVSGEPEDGTSGDADFSLRAAATETKNVKSVNQPEGKESLLGRLGASVEMIRLQEQQAEQTSRMLRYDGLFQLSLPPDAFERAPKLVEEFPVDIKTGRIPMMVPLEGNLYELTLKQAEDVYQQRKN